MMSFEIVTKSEFSKGSTEWYASFSVSSLLFGTKRQKLNKLSWKTSTAMVTNIRSALSTFISNFSIGNFSKAAVDFFLIYVISVQ